MRILSETSFDTSKHSNVNMLINNKLIDPVTLTKNLTYMFGKDSTAFPLTMLTEGNGFLKSLTPVSMGDTQYKWRVVGRMKHISKCLGLAETNVAPGSYGTPIKVYFEDKLFIKTYTVISPDGQHQLYLMNDGIRKGPKKYEYTMMPLNVNDGTFVPLSNFTDGLYWAMGATVIAAAKSDGTRSNSLVPGEMTNQFGYHRYSKGITGNVANKVLNIELDGIDASGKTMKTNTWIPWEMRIFELERRKLNEQDLWTSEYNRDANGTILATDPDTDEPLPRGAGVYEQIKSVGNYDTYADMTLKKFDNTINAIFANRNDSTPIEVVLYTGKGGARVFDKAVKSDASANAYFTPLGEQMISSSEGYLEYGKYFNRYKTIDGKIITVKVSSMFDEGILAEMQKANGDTIDGYARDSYTMVFLDQSISDDGERNVQLVAEKGREYQVGIYKGMTPLPKEWGMMDNLSISDRKDVAYYEVIDSLGIAIKNITTCFKLERFK